MRSIDGNICLDKLWIMLTDSVTNDSTPIMANKDAILSAKTLNQVLDISRQVVDKVAVNSTGLVTVSITPVVQGNTPVILTEESIINQLYASTQ